MGLISHPRCYVTSHQLRIWSKSKEPQTPAHLAEELHAGVLIRSCSGTHITAMSSVCGSHWAPIKLHDCILMEEFGARTDSNGMPQ